MRQVSDYEHLTYEQRGPVTIITINRPERMNAIGVLRDREAPCSSISDVDFPYSDVIRTMVK